MNPWAVISFDDENTVATVPNSWLCKKENGKDMCYWPSNSRNVSGHVRRRDRPEPDWQEYAITVLGNYETYEIAIKKAQKAEDTSELSSNNDTIQRRRTPNAKYVSTATTSSSESADEASSGTEYPKLPKMITDSKTKKRNNENVLSQTRRKTREKPQKEHVQQAQHFDNDEMPTPSFMPTPKTTFKDCDTTPTASSIRIAPSDKEFQKQVLMKLNFIIAKLGRHDEQLENIDAILATRPNDMAENAPPNTGIENLPLSDEDGLALLEQFINDPVNFKALAKELSRLGGQMVPEITRKIMYRTMTNEFAQLYSWEGGKGKRKFVNLTLSRVIIDAVRCNKRTSNACDDEIILEIKRWLVKAKERLQNENKKREKLLAAGQTRADEPNNIP